MANRAALLGVLLLLGTAALACEERDGRDANEAIFEGIELPRGATVVERVSSPVFDGPRESSPPTRETLSVELTISPLPTVDDLTAFFDAQMLADGWTDCHERVEVYGDRPGAFESLRYAKGEAVVGVMTMLVWSGTPRFTISVDAASPTGCP
jgi:hypothetical protein